jgi:nicotinamide-nucleotide amidase
VLRGGVVAYAAGVKYEVLGVPVGPVVTGDAARAMASGARRLLAADVGVAITGVSGPDPMEGVAVGTVYIGVAHGDDEWSELHLFDGDPDEICGLGTEAALAAVVRCLSDADVTARSPRPRPRDGAQPDERAPADVERLAAGGK